MIKFVHVLLALGALAVAGCSEDDDAPANSGATTVNLTLKEFTIAATPSSVKAGSVKFVAKNQGADLHEVVFVKTDLTPAQLPKNTDGTFNEDGQGVTVVDEIEDIAAGATAEKTIAVTAGHHVLVCNVVEPEEAGPESHFHEGMVVDFTVQ